MEPQQRQRQSRLRVPAPILRSVTAIVCAVSMLPGDGSLWAMQTQPAAKASTAAPAAADVKLSNDHLDSLVAPIALYPDPLLTQTLVASTYPLELVELHQWLLQNKTLQGKAQTDAVAKQKWDPSIQAMAVFPDLVKQLVESIRWTDELGNAFLAQQKDVMDAVQRMRAKAVAKGALKSDENQKVETKTVESKTVVVIEPSHTEVVYVPSYNPYSVWGAPYYPYPAYPYYPMGGALIGFGVGIAIGAAWGGGWGWNTGWGGNNDININRNNNFNQINGGNRNNIGNGNRPSNLPANGRGNGAGGGDRWQHNPQHRGGAPYGNRDTATKYGGAARGDAMGNRQNAAARQNGGRASASQQPARPNAGSNFGGAGGGERIGNRSVGSSGAGSRNNSAFSGSGSNRSSARSSSSRGSSSMGRSSGGMSRGGGGRSGGGGRRR